MRHRLLHLIGLVLAASLPARAQKSPTPSLGGQWVFTFRDRSGFDVAVRMTVRDRGAGRWDAWSREGAVHQMLSWPKSFAGTLLRKLPPHGAIVNVLDATSARRGDTLVVRGRVASPMLGNRFLRGTIVGGALRASLHRDTTAGEAGSVEGVRHASDAPLRDYRTLATRIRRAIADTVFDPGLMNRSGWRAFFSELDRGMARARDDLDAMLAFYAAKPRLATSHFELVRNPRIAEMPFDSAVKMMSAQDPATLVGLSLAAPGVAYLRVTRWHDATPRIDSVFALIDSAKSRALVIDLRANPGGDVSSMSPIAHLMRDSTPVGALVGRGWFARAGRPPTLADMRKMPRLSEVAGATVLHDVRRHGALFGIVPPRAPRFDGPVYVLIDRRTGSASEPLAYALKVTRRATLVGERTAGAMLSAPPHNVGDGWLLILPEADYYAADGTRIEAVGVAPDLAVSSAEAPRRVASMIEGLTPYASAMLVAQGYGSGAFSPEAERAWLEVHRLAPDSLAPLRGLGFAYQGQQRWADAFAMWDRVLAKAPQDRTALYQLGRTAVFSGQRRTDGERALRGFLALPQTSTQPTHATARWRLGMLLLARGDTTAARTEYEEALKLEPNNADVHSALRGLPLP